uniref:Deubiquitinating protein VCPIP1 N-terminal domain-containing protein n=1 Tax=Romanomermis culicivorax TaxID=13658 RepID=A0A915IDG0_ROMCU
MSTEKSVKSHSVDSKGKSIEKPEKPVAEKIGASIPAFVAKVIPCSNYDGYCPDKMCYERLMGCGTQNDFISCHYCGRVFQQYQLCYKRKTIPITFETDYDIWSRRVCRLPARTNPLWTRIGGYSAYYCYTVSEILQTAYLSHRMQTKDFPDSENSDNKRTSSELVKFFETIDKGFLGKYNFVVEEDMLLIPGFGIDMTGSDKHLHETLILIRHMNDGETLIVPLATPIKHKSLLCAVSRALIGREILCSILWEMMGELCATYKDKIRRLMTDIDYANMANDYKIDKISYPMVMGHVFIMANVLRRPIVLLDTFFYEAQSANLKQYCPKYSGLFLPTLVGDSCLNSPIVLAWASDTYDSIVPLMSTNLLKHIEKYNAQKYPTASAMLFCDYMENFNDTIDPTNPEEVELHLGIFQSQSTFLRCLICWRLNLHVDLKDLERGGKIYCALAVKYRAKFVDNELYALPNLGWFKYNKRSDKFEFVIERKSCDVCKFANGQLRLQDSNGFITFNNGDHSRTPAVYAKCARRMKHVYYGLEYDNGPTVLNLKLKLPSGQLIEGQPTNADIGAKILLYVSFKGALCTDATFECPYSVATYDELIDSLKKACPNVNWQFFSIEKCFLGTTYQKCLITKENEPFNFTELSNNLAVFLSSK